MKAGESLVSVVSALIGVAIIAVIVQSRNTAAVITASGNAFSNSARAVMGNTRG